LASHENKIDAVIELIANGPNLNIKDNYNQTALDYSETLGHTEIVKELIKKGADISSNVFNKYTELVFEELQKRIGEDEWTSVITFILNARKKYKEDDIHHCCQELLKLEKIPSQHKLVLLSF
jgi:ankyrin repeat protein